VSRVDFAPAARTVRVGARIPLLAVARDSNDAPVAEAVRWSVSDSRIASILGDSALAFLAAGNVTVTATAADKSANATFTVMDTSATRPRVARVLIEASERSPTAGDTVGLSAQAVDANGVLLSDQAITLTSSDPAIVYVASPGALVARAPGRVAIRASASGVDAQLEVTVRPRAVAELRLSPGVDTVLVGEGVRFVLNARDARGAALEIGSRVTWSAEPEGRVAIAPDGRVTGVTAGTVRILATADGVRAASELIVKAPTETGGASDGPERNTGTSAVVAGSAVYAGGVLTCATLEREGLACWGLGQSALVALTNDVADVSIGRAHACALARQGRVSCWGSNTDGQLGIATAGAATRPAPVAGELTFKAVSAGGDHTCALTVDGNAYCWGKNSFGQLGDGTTRNRSVPTPVSGNRTFRSIAAGGAHTCAVGTDGAVYCWGDDFSGAVGGGRNQAETEPVNVDRGRYAMESVTAGGKHSCGITRTGEAYCWGENRYGQVGVGSRTDRIPLGRKVQRDVAFTRIALGERHSCGVTAGGDLFCWGDNVFGQLGTGSAGERSGLAAPTEVQFEGKFEAVAAGRSHTCAVSRGDRVVLCWGDNSRSQLGSNRESRLLVPTPVTRGSS
jgi:hypothetical protein